MIDLRPWFNEALRNVSTWRNKYSSNEYPHKIVLNMMYRAYTTRLVFEVFTNDEMPDFDTFDEAIRYVIHFYGETALNEVHPHLEGWMENQPYEQVGTLSTANYERLARKAEFDNAAKEELEFSYIFELLNDMSVLGWIALRLTGLSEVDAISKMTGIIIEKLPYMDYTVTKQAFQQLLIGRYMHENYHPLP